jgi:purine-binding chemotaxis protein CheW
MAFFQPVVFRLDNEKYGIDISYVSGIEYEQTIVRVPNSSRNIKGIINLRGEVIPVLDLRTKFNMDNLTAPKDAELIIVNLPNNKIAIEVDGVEQIHHIDENDIVDMPEIAKSSGAGYFDRVAKLDGKLIIIINPLELLSEEELQAVNELTADKAE